MDALQKLLTDAVPYLLAGGFLSPVAAAVNKAIRAQKAIVKWLVVVLGAGIVATTHAFMITKSVDPNIVAAQTALVTFFASAWWLSLFKPLFRWLSEQFTKAAAFDAQIKSAAEPVEPTV